MPRTSKYAVPICALAVALLAGGAGAAHLKYPLSGMGTQKGPTIIGDKHAPRKPPTHFMGKVRTMGGGAGQLKGPPLRASGMGRLAGGEQHGDRKTPKRAPTFGVQAR